MTHPNDVVEAVAKAIGVAREQRRYFYRRAVDKSGDCVFYTPSG